MDHIVQGHVNALGRHIAHFERNNKPQIDKEFIAKNRPWNPIHLFVKVLQAVDEPVVISLQDLEGLINQFNQENRSTLTLKWFYDRHWIRVIFNIVELPPAISYAVHSFDGVKGNIQELRFLLWIISNKGRKINNEDFKTTFQDYQEGNNLILDLKADYFKNYVSEKDDFFELSHPAYFEQFVTYESEFHFLSFLKAKFKDGNQPVVSINSTDLQRLVSDHATEYSGVPPYTQFISEGIFQETEAKTTLHLNDYWRYFGNEIISTLWLNSLPTEKGKFVKWRHILFSQSWSQSAELYLPLEEKNILLKLLLDLLIDEPDFEPLSEEINKARLDSERDLMRLNPELFRELNHELLSSDTYYERLFKTDKIAHDSHSNLLMIQEARQNAFRLIRILIVNDGFYNDVNLYFTKKLIEQGQIKPFLSFAACENILNNRYDVLPYLLAEPDFSCLGLYLLSQVEAPTSLTAFDSDEISEKADHLSYLWDAGFEIFVKSISRELTKYPINTDSVSEIITEYLTLVFRLRYSNDRNWKYNKIFRQSESQLTQVEQIGKLILSNGTYSKVLSTLYDKVLSTNEPIFEDRIIVIPLEEIHLRFTILKWIEKASVSNTDFKQMLKQGLIQLSEVTNSYFNDERYDAKPEVIWGQQKNLDLLPWHELAEIYWNNNSIKKLLVIPQMKIDFGESNGNWDSLRLIRKNRYQIDRTRTYLLIISKILRGLKNKRGISTTIFNVEEFYLNLLQEYTVDNISNNTINILHHTFDLDYNYGKERLLPNLIHDLNSFYNVETRKSIISLVAERLAFQQLVEIWQYLSSEGDKELLKSVIVKRGLDSLFAESRWMPDFEMTLRILAWGNVFANELDTFVSKLTTRSRKDSDGLLFHLKLYQLYHKSDIEGIRSIDIPDNFEKGLTKDDYNNEKKLFEAILLTNEQQFESALNILKGLSYRKKRFTYSLNQFICLMKKAEHELLPTTKKKLFEEAAQFWTDELKQLTNESSSSLQSTGYYYQLLVYHNLERHDEFDIAYNNLSLPEMMDSDFLTLRVKNLIARSRESEANELYRKATEYHINFGVKAPDFLEQINTLLTSPSQLNRLASYYQQILNQRPEDIIKIVPITINPNNQNLIDFISYEIEYCLLELIKRVRSLNETTKETKYNDLLTSMLQARVVMYNWVVKDNSTGNKSGGGVETGERDIIIARNHIDIGIIECLHVFGRTDQFIQDHIAKIFPYSQNKMPKFIVGYYRGATGDFLMTWSHYKEVIFPATTFEQIYEPTEDGIIDLMTNSDGLLKGKSLHGNGHELIHIFVNLNLTA